MASEGESGTSDEGNDLGRDVQVLVSCVGHTDPGPRTRDETGNWEEVGLCKERITMAVEQDRYLENSADILGSVLTYYVARKPDFIFLLHTVLSEGMKKDTRAEAEATKELIEVLARKTNRESPEVHLLELAGVWDPTDHDQLLASFKSRIDEVEAHLESGGIEDYELSVCVSSGTPQMAHSWINWAWSGRGATLVEVRAGRDVIKNGTVEPADRVSIVEMGFARKLAARRRATDHFRNGRFLLAAEEIGSILEMVAEEDRARAGVARDISRGYHFVHSLNYGEAKGYIERAGNALQREEGREIEDLKDLLEYQLSCIGILNRRFCGNEFAGSDDAWAFPLDLFHAANRAYSSGNWREATNLCWVCYEAILVIRHWHLYYEEFGDTYDPTAVEDYVSAYSMQRQLLGRQEGWINSMRTLNGAMRLPPDGFWGDLMGKEIGLSNGRAPASEAIRDFASYRNDIFHNPSMASNRKTRNALAVVEVLIREVYCQQSEDHEEAEEKIGGLPENDYPFSQQSVNRWALPAIEKLI